ncbi:hypothetical protein GJ744_012132 [Endocarpon pusillum]|uniref:Uncharacterized protein n=1 Tax=Endocarpon pusillum TaxID=364733 RepID=A0A8H7AJF3_9EURO|nr:hypothetical protein GJ744_012132 [Endocarpon pusillum]
MPMIILERILPLAKPIRDNLIEVFHGPRGKDEAKAAPGNRNCVARLYLDKRRQSERPPRWFRLKNFSLHLNQAERIGLDTKTYSVEYDTIQKDCLLPKDKAGQIFLSAAILLEYAHWQAALQHKGPLSRDARRQSAPQANGKLHASKQASAER